MLAEMDCVFLEIGGLVPGLKTNRMPDAFNDIKESVAREGGIFGFLLWFGNRCGVSWGFLYLWNRFIPGLGARL